MNERRPADQQSAICASSTFAGRCPSWIVIGYGNELCGDDGVGPLIARAVMEWDLPDVQALTVQQLTPELAEPLAGARFAIFVDALQIDARARAATTDGCIMIHSVAPATSSISITHFGDPNQLLALAQTVYGAVPQAWWIMVPAINLDIGASMSPITQQSIAVALRLTRYLITNMTRPG